ncbi:MAG TPA: hypothetical protein VIH09_05685, partial [Flavobacterium sp.]|uniref:hypothetical protein n=1 Tax=Flavobacterium sp. TaxID=239 RepID=UPI002F3EBBD0
SFFKLSYNGLRLGEVTELEAQMFSLEQMFIRIPNVQFSTKPVHFAKALLAVRACLFIFIFFLQSKSIQAL